MTILVISPHADDETLGAGGTLLRLKKEGHKIYWLNITSPTIDNGWSSKVSNKREAEINKVCSLFNVDGFKNLYKNPSTLDSKSQNELIGEISEYVNQIKPEWVILPNPGDAHSDHYYVYKAAIACTKNFRYPFIKKVLTMEILSETNFEVDLTFKPNFFIDITDFFDTKKRILDTYASEFKSHPFPRSFQAVEALAILRGSQANCEFAEAFTIIKEVL